MTPPRILTLTGNLLAEHTFTFTTWETGRTQRASRASFQAGGKGINVSRMLLRLGVPSTALAFAGGETGAACVGWLTNAGLDLEVFHAEQPTRTGLVVRANERPETTFLGPDSSPGAAAIADCAQYLATRPDGELLAICGSLPGWEAPEYDPLRVELARWAARGVLVADTYGPPLAWLVTQRPALVKINADEFTALHGIAPSACVLAAETRSTVSRWIVTSGPGAVWVAEAGQTPARLMPPAIQEVSPTGSGDVLLAAVLAEWAVRGTSLRDAVTKALPLAAANAGHPGIAEFPLPS